MGVGGERHVPAALPSGKTRYPLYRSLGGAPGPRVRKIWLPPGFDIRTVQPVANRYTDYVMPAYKNIISVFNKRKCARPESVEQRTGVNVNARHSRQKNLVVSELLFTLTVHWPTYVTAKYTRLHVRVIPNSNRCSEDANTH